MADISEELAELLVPETVRHEIGLVRPDLAASLILSAYRLGFAHGSQSTSQNKTRTTKKRKKKP